MLEERFDQNFTLSFDSQKGVEPVATLDGRKIVVQSVDLQWRTDDDRYQGCKNYIRLKYCFKDEINSKKQAEITIRECLFEPENEEWFFPKNEV